MTRTGDDDLDRIRLPEDAARRLIERATELDARLASQSSIADLRDAARQAGISDEAFQHALDEARSAETEARAAVPARQQAGARRFVRPMIIVLIVAAVAALVTLRTSTKPPPPVPITPYAAPVPAAPGATPKTASPAARPRIATKATPKKQP